MLHFLFICGSMVEFCAQDWVAEKMALDMTLETREVTKFKKLRAIYKISIEYGGTIFWPLVVLFCGYIAVIIVAEMTDGKESQLAYIVSVLAVFSPVCMEVVKHFAKKRSDITKNHELTLFLAMEIARYLPYTVSIVTNKVYPVKLKNIDGMVEWAEKKYGESSNYQIPALEVYGDFLARPIFDNLGSIIMALPQSAIAVISSFESIFQTRVDELNNALQNGEEQEIHLAAINCGTIAELYSDELIEVATYGLVSKKHYKRLKIPSHQELVEAFLENIDATEKELFERTLNDIAKSYKSS